VACPFFMPTEPHERELWPHRYRLSLGDGFAGCCGAHAPESLCDDETLRLQCNLGYAQCVHLPADRAFDAVRFAVHSESGAMLCVRFVCERAHLPGPCGELHYDLSSKAWMDRPEPQLLQLADAAVRGWVQKHGTNAPH
jgi:hypothetical protein